MAEERIDVVTWLKQWYYTESEVDTLINGLQSQVNNKADTTTVNNLSTTVGNKADKNNGASQITDNNAYPNIGTNSGASQAQINTALNDIIGNLVTTDWIKAVNELPTESADTMGRFYVIANSGVDSTNNFDVYITIKNGNNYSWERLDELSTGTISIDWTNIQNKPSSFTPSNHNHSISEVTNLQTNLNNKADKTSALGTNITLANKGETNEGCIIFNTIS